MNQVETQEEILYESHPAMFRNRPVYFSLCIILIAAFGIGLVMLLIWYFQVIGTTLTVTGERTTLRRGVLSKYTNEVMHENVRNVQIGQTFLQRILGVGNIGISSAGQSGVEIYVRGIPDPDRIRDLIHEGGRDKNDD